MPEIWNLMLSMQRALLGAIYPSIRMITIGYDKELKNFTIRYYLDREPNEDDRDKISCVMAEVIGDYKFDTFNNIFEECIYSNDSLSKLEVLNVIVYAREENSYSDTP